MIPTSATVDLLEERPAPSLSRWRVEAWGQPPNDYSFVYEISAKTEREAAQEGIARFCTDVERILKAEKAQ